MVKIVSVKCDVFNNAGTYLHQESLNVLFDTTLDKKNRIESIRSQLFEYLEPICKAGNIIFVPRFYDEQLGGIELNDKPILLTPDVEIYDGYKYFVSYSVTSVRDTKTHFSDDIVILPTIIRDEYDINSLKNYISSKEGDRSDEIIVNIIYFKLLG